VRRTAGRVGDRSGVDDGVVTGHDRIGVAGVGQVGLLVRDRVAVILEPRAGEIGSGDVVAGVDERGDGRGSDLPARPCNEDPCRPAAAQGEAPCSSCCCSTAAKR
jgi:hypothetical protein